jgi:SAM-dependent methyltransferase
VDFDDRGVEGKAFAEQWQVRLRRWQSVRRELLFPQLAQLMSRSPPVSACDLGCGEGSTTGALLSAVPASCEVTAIDVNQTLLDACIGKFDGRVCASKVDLRSPARLAARFDLVLCCNVLMFLSDSALETTLSWLRHHVARGAVVVFSIVHPQWTLAANLNEASSGFEGTMIFPVGWDAVDANLYCRSVEWYAKTLLTFGFTIENSTTVALPQGSERFGRRFRNMDGHPVYWLARASTQTDAGI